MSEQICKCGHRKSFHGQFGCHAHKCGSQRFCDCMKFQPRELPPEEPPAQELSPYYHEQAIRDSCPNSESARSMIGCGSEEVIKSQHARIAELEAQLAAVTGERDDISSLYGALCRSEISKAQELLSLKQAMHEQIDGYRAAVEENEQLKAELHELRSLGKESA